MDQLGEIIAIITGMPYPIPNRDALQAAIAQAETRTQQNYTPQSWANLHRELEAAIAVYEGIQSTQDQIDNATESLLAAIAALVPVATTTPTPPPGTPHSLRPAATPRPATTSPVPGTQPPRTTTTNPETGAAINLPRPTATLPPDFVSNMQDRDPINDNLLEEVFQLAPGNVPARVGIYVGDLNLSDEQLVTLAGFVLNPQTNQYEIVRGHFNPATNTFYVDFATAGIVGIVLYDRPTPLLRFTIGQLRYYHNGTPMTSDVAPFISNNRTMVPIRIISEALGATPEWHAPTRTAYIHKGDTTLRLPTGQPLPGNLGTPEMRNNRVLVPARFVIENFNAITLWNAELQEVTVYTW